MHHESVAHMRVHSCRFRRVPTSIIWVRLFTPIVFALVTHVWVSSCICIFIQRIHPTALVLSLSFNTI